MWVLSSRNLSGLGVNFLGMTMETTFKGMMLSGMPRSLRRGRMHSSWGADAAPGDVIAECASCKEHVLCGFRAVLDPVAGGFLNCWFKANNNVQTGSLGKWGIGAPQEHGEHSLVADYSKVSWLRIHRVGRICADLNNLAHVFARNLFVGAELAGGTATLGNVLEEVCHCCLLLPFIFLALQRKKSILFFCLFVFQFRLYLFLRSFLLPSALFY